MPLLAYHFGGVTLKEQLLMRHSCHITLDVSFLMCYLEVSLMTCHSWYVNLDLIVSGPSRSNMTIYIWEQAGQMETIQDYIGLFRAIWSHKNHTGLYGPWGPCRPIGEDARRYRTTANLVVVSRLFVTYLVKPLYDLEELLLQKITNYKKQIYWF